MINKTILRRVHNNKNDYISLSYLFGVRDRLCFTIEENLNEIQALRSLEKAAKVSNIDPDHARELLMEINGMFSRPLVDFKGSYLTTDHVELTEQGAKTVRSYWRQFEMVWTSIMEERCRHYWEGDVSDGCLGV